MTKLSFVAIAALLLASCAGGGGSTPTPLVVAAGATAAPTNAPTGSPTNAPTTAPTVAPALKVIGGAPLSATAAQLANARKSAQAKTTAQGVTNGLPVLVESSGMVAAWAGAMTTWVTNAATSQDVPQTSGNITATNGILLNNPGFSQACIGSLAAACIVHPTAWEFGTSSANGKPVGKQTLTITFADGTTGTMADYVYDGWWMPTCGTGWVYQGGVPVATATRAASDMYADCAAGNIVFPQGAILAFNPVQDQYGQTNTIMPTITSAILMSSLVVNVPMAAIATGQVFGIVTKDGGFAKVCMGSNAVANQPVVTEGMSLHANADGTYPF